MSKMNVVLNNTEEKEVIVNIPKGVNSVTITFESADNSFGKIGDSEPDEESLLSVVNTSDGSVGDNITLRNIETPDINYYPHLCLGDHVTYDQMTSISDGSFDKLPIGAYWSVYGIKYRIMAHDHYYGYNDITTHHVVVMPDTIYSLQKYNNSKTNNGGYINSNIKDYIDKNYDHYIINIFGDNHVLSHPHDLTDGVRNNGELTTVPETKAWLVNSWNLEGTDYSYVTKYDWKLGDMRQFPAFRYDPALKEESKYGEKTSPWWLSTSCSYNDVNFAFVSSEGTVLTDYGDSLIGVRPAFLVY